MALEDFTSFRFELGNCIRHTEQSIRHKWGPTVQQHLHPVRVGPAGVSGFTTRLHHLLHRTGSSQSDSVHSDEGRRCQHSSI